MSRMETATVVYKGHNSDSPVLFTFDAKEFSLQDFSAWARTRFGLASDAALRFECKDKEVLPSPSLLKQSPIHIFHANGDASKKNTSSSSETAKAAPSPLSSSSLLSSISLFLLVLLNALTFAPHSSVVGFSARLGQQLLTPAWHKIAIDAYYAGLSWATCYLFIRRAWNPEHYPVSTTLIRYAADAIFGGICAGATVVMRHYLVSLS